MLKNYCKLALKHLLANKLYSLVNLLGLAVGLACCLLIGLYLRYELGWERHFVKAERIHVLDAYDERGGELLRSAWTSLSAAGIVQEAFPEIEATLRRQGQGATFFVDGQTLQTGITLADPNFFEFFEHRFLEGDPATALQEPASVVLSKDTAQRLFGSEPALGKVIEAQRYNDGRHAFRVTGVVDAQPANSSLNFAALLPLENWVRFMPGSVRGNDSDSHNRAVTTYLLLKEGSPGLDAERLDALARRALPQDPLPNTLGSYRLLDSHFQRFDLSGGGPAGSRLRLAAFAAMAACVLFIAMINFMNLSTVKALRRAKEVGLRKVCGATRGQLLLQFLGESLLQALLALLLAFALLQAVLPLAQSLLGVPLQLDLVGHPWTLPAVLGFTLLAGLGAGCYPALVLSSFVPGKVLKGEVTRGKRGALLRAGLVTLQFSAAVVLLVCALTVLAQMRFAQALDMGFTRDELVLANLPQRQDFDLEGRWGPLRARLLEHPGISDATHASSTAMMSSGYMRGSTARFEDRAVQARVYFQSIEPAYFDVHDIPLLAGRFLSADLLSDRLANRERGEDRRGHVMLSAEAARQLGWSPQEAVGQLLSYGGPSGSEVVGVVADTLRSVREPSAAILYSVPARYSYVSIPGQLVLRLREGDPRPALDQLEMAWAEFLPGEALEWRFLNEDLQRVYFQDLRQMRFFNGAAAAGLLIACLGLYALAALSTAQRAKEISLRKVLGGGVAGIVLLLSRRFTVLVLLATLIAWPLAWLLMQRWLAGFTFRIELGPGVFVLSGVIALLIAWITVAGTAARAARAKPALALRYE